MFGDTIHCHVSNVSRKREDGTERSVVAKAAYNAGVPLRCERQDRVFSFANRADVLFTKLYVPEGAPDWCFDRARLWNRVEDSAKRKDARLAKSIEAAFVREISVDERKALIDRFVAPFLEEGIVVDVAIHEDGTDHNPHVHFLLTTQEIEPDGFGKKLTFLDSKKFLHGLRARWADETNAALRASGSGQTVDHRSYKKRGVDRVPGRHRGINGAERSYKRDRAQTFRDSEGLMKPTDEERLRYPHLVARGEWPPASPYPDQAMTDAARGELKTYFEDRRTPEENRSLSEDDVTQTRDPEERPMHLDRAEEPRPWYEQALAQAKGHGTQEETRFDGTQTSRDYAQEIGWAEERAQQQSNRRSDLVRRAIAMDRTKEEHEIIKSAEHEPKEVRDGVKRVLFEERIARLERSDERERRASLERAMQPSLRDKLRSAVQSLREPEGDRHREEHLPVPDPDRNPISQKERDEAERKMMQGYER